MKTQITSHFGARPITADQIEYQQRIDTAPHLEPVSKWTVLAHLGLCAKSLNISARNLAVLQVLLSFHPEDTLNPEAPLIVFASNAAIQKRAHGMPESTLRRHLMALVDAGLLIRRDSPNGKRYARRTGDGQIGTAYGFDLKPLAVRAAEFAARAAEEQQRMDAIKTARELITLTMRDIFKFIEFAQSHGAAGNWDAYEDQTRLIRRTLRRNMTLIELRAAQSELSATLHDIKSITELAQIPQPEDATAQNNPEIVTETAEMSGSGSQNERHYQRSDKKHSDKPQELTLAHVLSACPDVHPYTGQTPRGWNDFIRSMSIVAPMTGIDSNSWKSACIEMGPERAAATVAALVQRCGDIRNPGAYFRVLTRKAKEGRYSPLSMLNTLSAAQAC
ncbi:plasmid replication protein RepC [Pseudooceanicola sp. C21-150M6]|uniref:plasmid replication protein RepC n=1 Tax=Pseudooceanicola sp. C21-150M6 TaxID=3434355 RepID=UPI003D7F44A0